MKNPDLYEVLGLSQYSDGGVALHEELKINLNSKLDVITKLDSACETENLNPLGKDWNELKFSDFQDLLISSLRFSIGFLGHEKMTLEKAKSIYTSITNNFDNIKECRFFTNWYNNPWKEENKYSFSANSISDATIDLAVSIISNKKLLLLYFLFED